MMQMKAVVTKRKALPYKDWAFQSQTSIKASKLTLKGKE